MRKFNLNYNFQNEYTTKEVQFYLNGCVGCGTAGGGCYVDGETPDECPLYCSNLVKNEEERLCRKSGKSMLVLWPIIDLVGIL